MFKRIAAIALALFAASAQAQVHTKAEQGWLQAIGIFAADAKAAGMGYEVEKITTNVGEVSPVAAEFKDGKCIIRLAVRGNPYSQAVQTLVDTPAGAAVARVTAVAHEFGHCMHSQALAKGEALPSEHSAASEAMADVYALAWVQANAPSHFDTAAQFLRKLRSDASDKYSASIRAINQAVADKEKLSTINPVAYAAMAVASK